MFDRPDFAVDGDKHMRNALVKRKIAVSPYVLGNALCEVRLSIQVIKTNGL